MNLRVKRHPTRKVFWFTLLTVLTTVLIQPVRSTGGSSSAFVWPVPRSAPHSPNAANKTTVEIPSGTILPARLDTSLSTAKSKSGQKVHARIAQNVPLPDGSVILAGSKVEGRVIKVVAGNGSTPGSISIRFNQLHWSSATIPINTSLRALAGFMEVLDAQTPTVAPGEGDVEDWMTTRQIGGEVVYGVGGDVTTEENASKVVGSGVAGGVLSQVRSKDGTKCRGAIEGNDSPQALWVFSSDACGTYGLEHIRIAHAGRTEPAGVIVLASDRGNLKLAAGAGMLLRIRANLEKRSRSVDSTAVEPLVSRNTRPFTEQLSFVLSNGGDPE